MLQWLQKLYGPDKVMPFSDQSPQGCPTQLGSHQAPGAQTPPKNVNTQRKCQHPAIHHRIYHQIQQCPRMVKAWYKSQNPNEIMEGQIETWIKTCDLLTENSYLKQQQDWKLPTFQPWCHYDTHLFLQQYFYIQRRIHMEVCTSCSHPGRKPAFKCSKETSPQSPNASGTINSSTNKEERARSGRSSSMTPPFKLGEESKKTSEEKLREKRKPLTQQPHTPPSDLPKPKALPGTSNGTGDSPPPPYQLHH
jgi:hypothetical protein